MILGFVIPQIKIITNDIGRKMTNANSKTAKVIKIKFFQDAKVVTIFNMIAVPCFVYQGAVGLLGERLQYIIEEWKVKSVNS